jgi:hypothetical protein
MLKRKNRKGIFVVLFGLLFVVLMGAAAMSIDMSRIWTMRNELQTAADAGALAGAVQLSTPHDASYANVRDSATIIARLNRAQYDTVKVDSVETGVWDDDAATFDLTLPQPHNAVRVVVSHGTNKMIMGLLGVAAPRVKARAIAWANAPVNNQNCLRPWSIPYVLLMQKVNLKREALAISKGDPRYNLPNPGGANDPANLTRPFTDLDRDILNEEMSVEERTFKLKMGSGNGNQTTVEDPPPGSTAPGNYQAVKLPRKRSASGTVNPDGIPPQSGADAYMDAISGAVCYPLGIGDVLEVQTGDMVGPTLMGIERNGNEDNYVCYTVTNTGDCLNEDGTAGVDIKAAFHLCVSGCSGAAEVTVQMLGSFTLTKVQPVGGGAPDPENPPASITGIFKPVLGTGPVGPGPTSIRRIILVR